MIAQQIPWASIVGMQMLIARICKSGTTMDLTWPMGMQRMCGYLNLSHLETTRTYWRMFASQDER